MTDQKQTLYQALFEKLPDAILLHEGEMFVDCNASALKVLRSDKSKEEILPLHPAQLSPEYQPDGRRSDEKASEMIRTAHQNGSHRFEWMHRRLDGEVFPVEVTLVSLPHRGQEALFSFWRDMTEQKQLEEQVQHTIERRERQVRLSTQVTQAIAAATNLDELYQRVVSEVKEQFGYYHVQLLRYDPQEDAVKLAAGYGEIGEKMLEQGHQMPMGTGLIGTAAATGEPVLRPALIDDPDWKPNPLLPQTKGEIAVPIKFKNEVLGVLDVQSSSTNALTADDQLLLEDLCGQIAIAIENTRANEEARRLADLVEKSLDGTAVADIDGHILFANPAWAAMHGYEAEELIGKHLSIFHTPEQVEQDVAPINEKVMTTGLPHQAEVGHMRRDGTTFPTWMTISLLYDKTGTPNGIAAWAQDITERKLAETNLSNALSEANTFRQVVHATGQGIGLADLEGNVIYVNPALIRLLGHKSDDETVNKPISQFYQPEVANRLSNDILPVVMKTGSWTGEMHLTRKDGVEVPTIHSLFVVQDEDGNPQFLGNSVLDISEQKRAEEAQRLLAKELEERLELVQALQRTMTREGWKTFLLNKNRDVQGFVFAQDDVQSVVEVEQTLPENNDHTMIAPIAVRGEAIGRFGMRNPSGKPLTAEQRDLLQAISQQVAEALEQARLFEETELRASELAVINAISELASSQLDLPSLFSSVSELLQATFAAESLYFALYDKKAQLISFPYFFSKTEGFIDVSPRSIEDGGYTGQIIVDRKSMLRVFDSDAPAEEMVAEGAQFVGSDDRDTDCYLGTPMIVGNEIVGVVALSSYREVRTYNEQDQQLLETLADTIGVAVQNIRQFQVAQRRAEREALINSISQKIQSAPTVQSALQTAVSELGQALKLKKAAVALAPGRKDSGHSQN